MSKVTSRDSTGSVMAQIESLAEGARVALDPGQNCRRSSPVRGDSGRLRPPIGAETSDTSAQGSHGSVERTIKCLRLDGVETAYLMVKQLCGETRSFARS